MYFVDKAFKVLKIVNSNSATACKISYQEVCQIPSINRLPKGNYNVTIVFASPDIVLLSNGSGVVYIGNVTMKQESEIWDLIQTEGLYNENNGCILVDSKIDCNQVLHIVSLLVEEKIKNGEGDVAGSSFQSILKWGGFIKNDNGTWCERFWKKLSCDGNIDYVALEKNCHALHIISDKIPEWIFDSENPIIENNVQEHEVNKTQKIYYWKQTGEDINLWLTCSETASKTDLEVEVDECKIVIKFKNETVIKGNFYGKIDKDLTTWTFDKNKLDVHFTKQTPGLTWKTLLEEDDDKGEEIIDDEIIQKAHEKLAHLCSEQEEGVQPSFNTQQLEECDAVTCDTSSLLRLHSSSHLVTHEVSLSSSQWLFKVVCEPSETPAICCRHDVDACIWQMKEVKTDDKTWPHEHVGTFSAFGYVQASKSQKKFLASPSNLSYVVVCDASHHIYLYRQPSNMSNELKNRLTGQKVKTVSKQQVINLETKERILGVHASDVYLYVLLENSVCILVINE